MRKLNKTRRLMTGAACLIGSLSIYAADTKAPAPAAKA